MTEEIKKPQPDAGSGGQANKPDTEVKSVEQLQKELAEANEKTSSLEKQVKEKDSFIGRQSTEIGELRKSTKPEGSGFEPEPKRDAATDSLIKEIAEELEKSEGLSRDNAEFNARVLAKFGDKILEKKLKGRMKEDVVDLLDEALEDGKIDRKVFEENEKEIYAEFRGRKMKETARQNFKVLRECVDVVVKRKAAAVAETKKTEAEKGRDKLIASGQLPPGGGQKPAEETNKDATDAIRNAGEKKDSVFF